MRKIILLTILLSFCANARFITGLGYIKPEEYRTDNEENPLPFGMSVIPMIAYRGERLSVLGPRVSYALKRGAIALNINANVAGDNYKAYEVKARETAWHAGLSMRLYFLMLRFGTDVSGTHNGSISSVGVGHRFRISERLILMPSIRREFLSSTFVKYYYSVSAEEVGEFSQYDIDSNAADNVYSMSVTYVLNESNSIMINYRHRQFDKVIYDSPTIALENFDTWSVFWNYTI